MGKLFFYSDQIIETPGNERLDQLLLKGKDPKTINIGYIPSTEDPERIYFNLKVEYYRNYGIRDILFFDLYSDFDPLRIDELLQCDIIHLSAGNPIELNKAIKHRKLEKYLQKYFDDGGTLAGVSAGAVQFGKSTKLFHLFIEDTSEELEALQFVDFEFLPHYNRWTTDYIKQVQAYAIESGTTVYAGNDGDGIIIEDGKIKFIGDIITINNQRNL